MGFLTHGYGPGDSPDRNNGHEHGVSERWINRRMSNLSDYSDQRLGQMGNRSSRIAIGGDPTRDTSKRSLVTSNIMEELQARRSGRRSEYSQYARDTHEINKKLAVLGTLHRTGALTRGTNAKKVRNYKNDIRALQRSRPDSAPVPGDGGKRSHYSPKYGR